MCSREMNPRMKNSLPQLFCRVFVLTFGSRILRSRLSSRCLLPTMRLPPLTLAKDAAVPTFPQLPLITCCCLLASSRRRARSTRANVGLSRMDGVRLVGPEFGSDVTSITALKMFARNYTAAPTRTRYHRTRSRFAEAQRIVDREITALTPHTNRTRTHTGIYLRALPLYCASTSASQRKVLAPGSMPLARRERWMDGWRVVLCSIRSGGWGPFLSLPRSCNRINSARSGRFCSRWRNGQ